MRFSRTDPRARSRARGAVSCALAFLVVPVLAPAVAPVLAQESAPPPVDTVEIAEGSANVTGALQGQDGVRIQTMCTHCNSANIQVGGLSQDLVPITYGGYPLFGGLATSFVLNMLPADSVAEARVLRGPGSASEAAQAAGGVIDLLAAQPAELPVLDVGVDAGSFNRRGFTLRGAGALTSWLSGVLTYNNESADAVDDDEDGWNDISATDRQLADARVYVTPAKGHRIELGGSWIDEQDPESRGMYDISEFVDYLFEQANQGDFEPGVEGFWTREDADFERFEYRLGYEWRMKGGRVLSARTLAAEREQHVFAQDSAGDPLVERYNIEERNYWGQLRLTQPIGLSARLAAAVESTSQYVQAEERVFSGFGTVTEPGQTATDRVQTWSGWVAGDWTPSSRWELGLGARYDDDAYYGAVTSPRASVKFIPRPGLAFRALAGRTFRPPKSVLSEVCCGRKYLTNVEAGIKGETAWTYGLDALYQPSPELKVGFYVAQTDFDDYIFQPVARSLVYRQIYANANIAEARAQTAELSARYTIGPLRLDGSVGWLSFHNTGDPQVLVRYRDFVSDGSAPPSERLFPVDQIPYRPTRTGSVGVAFEFGGGATGLVQANYTGPQLIQQYAEIDSIFELTTENLVLDEMRSIGGFWTINAGVTIPYRSFEINFGVDNLTDEIQYDLGDPTRDYNWGPLAGQTLRLNLRYRFER